MPPPEKPQNNDGVSVTQPLKPWQQGYRFDLNGKDGTILIGDAEAAGAKADGAPGILNQAGNADAHLPKATIEEKQLRLGGTVPAQDTRQATDAENAGPKPEDLNRSFIDPTLRAFTARFAYLAATDSLTADNASITRTLKKAGPMGEQLLG